MFGAAIGKIVAVHRGNDDMGQAQFEGGFRDMLRLQSIERAGHTGLDVAEGAGAGAGVAHDHEGGVLLVPALADVGATRLLAHRDEAVFLDDFSGIGVTARVRRADPIQSGFGGDSASGRFTFSGWRGRSFVSETVSTTTTMECPL